MLRRMIYFLFIIYLLSSVAHSLDNGLALTPPMGWLSWERFTCNVDCKNDPKNCISENLYRDMADYLVKDGFKDVGYEFVNIDDCWMEKKRDKNKVLQADPSRFPSGIRNLSDYVHSKGLKLGIYQDCGTKTCGGYPGSYGFYDIDTKTFAQWGIDMLKVDGCYAEPKDMDDMYPTIGAALNNTGRPIVYSCSWPDYQREIKMKIDYANIAKHCNLWRNYDDIEDSWESVLKIIDYYAQNQDILIPVAGPGQWNDPDMVIGGNFGLSYDQAKAQFMLWAIMASPLLMSNDLRALKPEFRALLQNKEIIAVNQDLLGKMGRRIYNNSNIEIWTRPITPISKDGKYSFSVLFFNRRTLGGPSTVTAQLHSIGLDNVGCYEVNDVFDVQKIVKLCPFNNLTMSVNPSSATMVVAKVM